MLLSYFNFNFLGQNVVLPRQPTLGAAANRSSNGIADTPWRNSSRFVLNFPDAIMPGPLYDWQRSVLMDPGDATWRAFLVQQVLGCRLQNGLLSFPWF